MKDIIASQKVRRRPKASLLDSASTIRFPEPFFITEQRTGGFFAFLRGLKKSRPRPRIFPLPPSSAAPAFLPKIRFSFSKKRLAAVLALCAFLPLLAFGGSMLYIAFIPEPEPPEEGFSAKRPAVFSAPVTRAEEGVEIPLDLTESFVWQNYTVKSGDSVEGIARRFGLSIDAVIASNDIKNVRRGLRIGEKIRIPNMDGIPYTIKSGDSYGKIAQSMDVPLEAILDANDIQSDAITAGAVLFIPGAKMNKDALRQALGELFIYPLRGRQTSPFGWRRDPFTGVRSYHAALDLAAPAGTPVKASRDGRVSSVGFNAVYGNFIIISHSDNYQTMYAHLSKILVSRGTYVSQGVVIGRVGSTGRSTGAHLHFAAYRNGRAINPLEVLNQ
ncbi:MAG: M23 family metallopeptidase [Treponema sp.]|jgi:murein DD-endopeptidase MepM/ murein hydrolase activator NlpD|nr:M23 family metallopeptidase [Treponema sp.]